MQEFLNVKWGREMDLEYMQFCDKIKRLTTIDLHQYKESQMNRRLRTLFNKRGFQSYHDYYQGLTKDEGLLEEFLDRMTINVTEFFRNSSRWKTLEEEIIQKELIKQTKIKCWSAACSTGEEPYTIAMILNKYVPLERIEIIATDIDKTVLKKAKEGIYQKQAIEEIPKEYIDKHFIKLNENEFAINERLKEVIKFKQHDMLNERFDRNFDLIVCRNVMIYFTDSAKDALYIHFNQSLREGGYLFIGSTEQIFYPEKINYEVKFPSIYQKKIPLRSEPIW